MKDYTRIALAIALGALFIVVSDFDFSFIGHGMGHVMKPLLIGLGIYFIVTRCGGGCCRTRAHAPEAPADA